MWAIILAIIATALLFWGRREGADETLNGADEIRFLNEPKFSPLPPPAEMLPPRPELSLPSAPMPAATSIPQPVGGAVQSIPISTEDGPVVINIYKGQDILSGNNNGKASATPVGGPVPAPQQSA
jgi:hypothetical protein